MIKRVKRSRAVRIWSTLSGACASVGFGKVSHDVIVFKLN